MQEIGAKRPQTDGTQCVIAAFDEWDALQAALDVIGLDVPGPSSAILHARSDTDANATGSRLAGKMQQLDFAHSHQHITCTAGLLAEMLAAGLARGARAPADVLGQWLSAHQARQLQHHIESGRLILWLELRSSEEFGTVCAQLVRASPHVVELCNVRFKA
jgi:hypothetical protein